MCLSRIIYFKNKNKHKNEISQSDWHFDSHSGGREKQHTIVNVLKKIKFCVSTPWKGNLGPDWGESG